MEAIKKKIQALQSFQDEAEQKVIEEVKRNESFALFLVTSEQLDKGFDGEGNPIKPPYTAFTRAIKRKKGQPTNRVTLKDTGDFHGAMMILYGPEEFRLINTDWKAQKLRTKYGTDILGLNETSMDDLAGRIKPGLINEFNNVANGS